MINIVIPLCGKGERFAKEGYAEPKPLVWTVGKRIFWHVLDSLRLDIHTDVNVFVLYHADLDHHNFSHLLHETYNTRVTCIKMQQRTLGAAHTIELGLQYCLSNQLIQPDEPIMSYDCDTVYTEDTIGLYKQFRSHKQTQVLHIEQT